jgi:hypothetical protein
MYSREITLFVEGHLDPRKSALAFAEEVRRRLAGMVAAKRVPPKYRHFVDGREGADFRAVRPGGTIAAAFSYNADILLFALSFLQARSPSRTGNYRNSFFVGIGGKFVMARSLNPAHVPDGPVELVVGNTQPYHRKVDVQTVGNRRLRFSVPPGMFHDAAKAVNARFGNVVTAKRVHDIDFPSKYRLKQAQMRTGTRSHSVKRGAGTYVESPALIINPR